MDAFCAECQQIVDRLLSVLPRLFHADAQKSSVVQDVLKCLRFDTTDSDSCVEILFGNRSKGNTLQPCINVHILRQKQFARQKPDIYHELAHVISLDPILMCIATKPLQQSFCWGILTYQCQMTRNTVVIDQAEDFKQLNEILTDLAACFLYHLTEGNNWHQAWMHTHIARTFCTVTASDMEELVYSYFTNNTDNVARILCLRTGCGNLYDVQQLLRYA